MLCAGKELVLLCFIFIIQHVTGSSYLCSRGCCYPSYSWCGSYGNSGSSNHGGWNEYRYQNCHPCYQRVSNGKEECCDSCCRTGRSNLMNTLGYGRWANQGNGYGWNTLGSTDSYIGHTGLGFNARNGGWISLGQSNDYSENQNNGAGYNTWNTPNRFDDYGKWNSQGYRTTSYDGLNILTCNGALDGLRTQGHGTILGHSNTYGGGQCNRAGYNTWNSPNIFSDYAGWNSLRYGTKSYGGLNSLSDSAGYAGLNSFVSPERYGGLIGQGGSTGDEWDSLRTSADYNRQNRIDSNTRRISNNVIDYADWDSLGGASSYDGWNSHPCRTGYGSTSIMGWNDLRGGGEYEGMNSQGTVTGYDGSIIFTNSAGYGGSVGLGSSTGTGWNAITTDATGTSPTTESSVAGYDGWNSHPCRTGYGSTSIMGWNDLRGGAEYEGLNSQGTVTGYDGSNIFTNSAGYGGSVGLGSSTGTGWNAITTDATGTSPTTESSVAGYDGWNTMRIGAGYNAWNNPNSWTTLEEITPADWSVAAKYGLNGITRGYNLERIGWPSALIVYDGRDSDGSGASNDDCGSGIYKVWENLSNYAYL